MTQAEQDWFGPDTATFGDRLAAARDEAGLSQMELAKRLGIRLDTLRKWEEDRVEPRANRLSMIAGVLNVSIMWLLSGVGDGLTESQPMDGVDPVVLPEVQALRGELLRALDRLDRLEAALGKRSEDAIENGDKA